MIFKKNIIAVIYDFDGTLSPQPMYNYGVLPKLNVKPKDFWEKVEDEAQKTDSDQMLCYMRLLLEESEKKGVKIDREELKKLSKKIKFFDGAETHFKRLRDYVKRKGKGQVKVRFYLITAGLQEIIEGVGIKKEFEKIFASSYNYNEYDKPTFPRVLVNDTLKTQYLFRINKGKEKQHERINQHMPEEKRPIPFRNIIYVGDGETDVPGMTVTIKQGGHSIAVYKPRGRKAKNKCIDLYRAGRVNYIAPADFREGSDLINKMKITLDLIIQDIIYSKSIHKQKKAIGKNN